LRGRRPREPVPDPPFGPSGAARPITPGEPPRSQAPRHSACSACRPITPSPVTGRDPTLPHDGSARPRGVRPDVQFPTRLTIEE
jgi:hypothetical protein